MDSKIIIILIIIVAIYAIIIQQKIRDFLNDKLLLNSSKSTYIKIVIGISLFSIICTMCNSPKVQTYDYRDEIEDRYKQKEKEMIAEIKRNNEKNTYNAPSSEEKINSIISELKNGMIIETKGNLITFLDKIDRAKNLIYKSNDNALTEQLKKELISFQKLYFPKARKVYYQNAKNELWEKDIEVSMSGKNITFTGYMFVNNKVVKDTYLEIKNEISNLRFNTVGFRAFDGDDRTYWELNPKKDSEI